MDHKNVFMFTELLSFTFFLLVKIALSADWRFESCLPQTCGNGLNISYPFWIEGNQSPFCGSPGFGISCKNNEPIFKMSGDDHVIHDIVYDNQSVWITKVGMPNDICSPLNYGQTFSHSFFTLVPSNFHLFLLNCTTSLASEYSRYSIGCTTDNLRHRSLVILSDDPMLESVNRSGQCETLAVIPIDPIGNESLDPRNLVIAFLNKGFHLRWNASVCSECAESKGRCGFDFDAYKFMCFCPDRPHQKRCGSSKDKKRKIGIAVGTGAGGIFLTCIIFIFIIYRRRKKHMLSNSSTLISRDISPDPSLKPDPEKGSTYFQTPIFTYKELDEATNHFDSEKELGDGGFGTVYYGKLRDGRVVAVKRLFENNYKRVEQFMNEITILSRIRHRNLVSLYGCTNRHSRELLLVYEFVPNGTVADHLHGERANAGLLTWPIRMSIAIESADALAYLHASDIIHRDVKTTNILLDNGFHVKVADFGLSRLFPTDVTHVSTAPQGTPGYVDPEYYQCYQLNDKSDVYSFGVVLIELISSKPAVDISRHRHEINLANMAINKIHNQALHELVDPRLGFDSDYTSRTMITLVAELAFRCLQQEKEMRPSMNEVLEILKGIESEEYKMKKPDEMEISADARLLKSIQPLSPDSVTDKWASKSTTPNTSG